ncbi:MAG: NAD-glutamate dehydrogenase [Mariniblastus sp.]|nr:NAD-glutamate dehydrogenase [Mariniblastus sp.]
MNDQTTSHSGIDDTEINRLRQQIFDQIDGRIADVLGSLPSEYFEQLDDAERLEHFKALVALKVCDIDQEIMLREQDGSRVTIISAQNYPGQLARMMKDLPSKYPLVSAKIFTSAKEDFIVDVFEYQVDESDLISGLNGHAWNRDSVLAEVMTLTNGTKADISGFIDKYHRDNEILSSAEEIAAQYTALQKTEHVNDIKVLYRLSGSNDPNQRPFAKITISAASATAREIVERAATYLGLCGYDIRRALCDNIIVGEAFEVALLTFHVVFNEKDRKFLSAAPTVKAADSIEELVCREMETFIRIDEEVVEYRADSGNSLVNEVGGLEKAEVLCGLARLVQHKINFSQRFDLSRDRVIRGLIKHKEWVSESLDVFMSRFGGNPSGAVVFPAAGTAETLEAITDHAERAIMRAFCSLIAEIERCNVSLKRRRSLAFRMPGTVFDNPKRGEIPYAVFYVYGSGFDGFHVRFREVARGGMRLVPTRNQEHYLYNSVRVYEEAWRLAAAQQLKNKDIAEGGAKAVVVIKPEVDHQKAGRDFVDGLLDMVTEKELTQARDMPDSGDEYLYLGPDEYVSDGLIDWVVERSRERNYPFPSTIMSSRAHSGINHKKYGVTSEGVLVFLRYALIDAGIDPKSDAFSVKLTGGPDGDVGGNAIRILIRDYPDQVSIVGVSDGTGSAIDPEGLDHAGLLTLVERGEGICHFPKDRLSSQGMVSGLNNEIEIARRNNLHNEVLADVFLPAGGRPSTINSNNCSDFLDSESVPSSPIIVEGANLFITDAARDFLGKAGVTIVRDSSANKCGVICSSMEIIAAMLLQEEEFLAIKPKYVEEVLELLRRLAATEALGLFNERLRQPEVDLPRISVKISVQMIRLADLINHLFEQWTDEEHEISKQFILDYLPKSLVAFSGATLIDRIPANYRRHLVSAILSSRIVYREGCLGLESMQDDALERLIRSQLLYEKQVREMITQLEMSDLPDKDAMMKILDFAGARCQRDLRMLSGPSGTKSKQKG